MAGLCFFILTVIVLGGYLQQKPNIKGKLNNDMKKIKLFIAAILLSSIPPVIGQWQRTNFPQFSDNPPLYIFQLEKGLYASNSRSFFKSIDNGSNWYLASDVNFFNLINIVEMGNTLIAITDEKPERPDTTARVFRSTDGGQTWDSLFYSAYNSQSIVKLNSKLFMDNGGYLYCSADSGKNWTLINTSIYFTKKISKLLVSENSIYAIIMGTKQLFKSDDEGLTWTCILSLDNTWRNNFHCAAVKDSMIFVGTAGAGCLKSTNNGLSWSKINQGLPESSGFESLLFCEDFIIGEVVYNPYRAVYKIHPSDTIWSKFNDGLTISYSAWIWDFEYNRNFLFLASNSSIWRRPISELTTGAKNDLYNIVPEEFHLTCFPNPFKSFTTLSFNMKANTNINLTIFDILGRKVATLFDGRLDAGGKRFAWHPARAASGLYFARLRSQNRCETIKITLVSGN